MHERETGTRARNKTRRPVFFSGSSPRPCLSLSSLSLTSTVSFFGFTLRSSLPLTRPFSPTAAPVLIYTRYVCARRFFSQFLEICKKLVGHSDVPSHVASEEANSCNRAGTAQRRRRRRSRVIAARVAIAYYR